MKKLIFGTLLVISAITLLIIVNQVNKIDNEFLSLNVDALAQTENVTGCTNAAYEYSETGNIFQTKKSFRRCGDCKWVTGYNPKYGC